MIIKLFVKNILNDFNFFAQMNIKFFLGGFFAKSISIKTSLALAVPRLIIKLACFNEICAPPMIAPFNPQSSIILAANCPGELTNNRSGRRVV